MSNGVLLPGTNGRRVRIIYWGLDDHVDHHLFPTVPSCNLPRLHKLPHADLPQPRGLVACWREMFAIAREKDARPQNEFVPAPLHRRAISDEQA